MAATDPGDSLNLVALVYSFMGGLVTFTGAALLKKIRPVEAPTLEQQLIDKWEQIAARTSADLEDCREERTRQDDRIGALELHNSDQSRQLEQMAGDLRDLRSELNQWRDGRRVPAGFQLTWIGNNGPGG